MTCMSTTMGKISVVLFAASCIQEPPNLFIQTTSHLGARGKEQLLNSSSNVGSNFHLQPFLYGVVLGKEATREKTQYNMIIWGSTGNTPVF